MSDSSDHAELDIRDDDTLVFARVGQGVQLCCKEEDQARHNDVPLTSAADHGVICVGDANGIYCTTLQITTHVARTGAAAAHTPSRCVAANSSPHRP